MDLAIEAAKNSVETTKVGAAVVGPNGDLLAVGYNAKVAGDPAGVEHAERAALYACARDGVATSGASMFSTLFACVDCARAIAMSGIASFTSPEPDWEDAKWGASWTAAKRVLDDAGVQVTWHRPGCVDEDVARAVLTSAKVASHKVTFVADAGWTVTLTKAAREHHFETKSASMTVTAFLESPWPHVMIRVKPFDADKPAYCGAVNFMGEVCLPLCFWSE